MWRECVSWEGERVWCAWEASVRAEVLGEKGGEMRGRVVLEEGQVGVKVSWRMEGWWLVEFWI